MKFYSEIPIWENARRIRLLRECRSLVITYFTSPRPGPVAGGSEGARAASLHSRLAGRIKEVESIVAQSGVDAMMTIPLPHESGGMVRKVNVIGELLNAQMYAVDRQQVYSLLDRSLKVYEANRSRAWLRAFNPLFYIGALFELIATLPFRLLGALGFDRAKAEFSTLGRIGKVLIIILEIVAFLVMLLKLIGFWRKYWGLIDTF